MSSLGRLFSEAQDFARDWKDAPQKNSSTESVIRMGHAHRITIAIMRVLEDDSKEARELVRRIAKKTFDLGDRIQSQGKDALWELELYDRILTQGALARLAEPDIVADFGFGPYSLACKKIYSVRNLGSIIEEGARQIEGSGNLGLVAVNIDDLIAPSELQKFQAHSDLQNAARTVVNRFIVENENQLALAVRSEKVDGVFVAHTSVGEVVRSTARFITSHWASVRPRTMSSEIRARLLKVSAILGRAPQVD